MKFYRMHMTHSAGESAGFEYFTNKTEAQQAYREWMRDGDEGGKDATITQINIKPTSWGILQALKLYASHPDNG